MGMANALAYNDMTKKFYELPLVVDRHILADASAAKVSKNIGLLKTVNYRSLNGGTHIFNCR